MATGKLVSDAIRRLNEWLEAGKFKEGDRLPSERAIAKELGIKYYGLNRAMSQLIAEGRVQREGYRLSISAAPRTSRRWVFHLIVSRRTHHLASYRRAAANLDIELIVHDWVAAEEVASILTQLDAKETAGVVCDPPTESVHAAEWLPAALQLVRHGIPVVCTGGWGMNGELSAVGANVNHGVTMGISHLTGLGHRELALVTFPAGSEREMSVVDYWARLCGRNHLGTSADRILLQPSWLTDSHDIDQLVELLVDGPWKNVTGVVSLVGYNADMQLLFTKLARRGRRVPESLSVVVVGNAKTLASSQPRTTSVGFDMVLWFELTFDLLLREIREKNQFGALRDPVNIQVMPRLMVRDSTRALNGAGGEKTAAAPDTVSSISFLQSKDVEQLERLAKKPYPLAAKASLSEKPRFAPVDLLPFVNRPLIFRRGWLGDIPLRCLPPGTHEIHGVPFQVLGGPNRADCGAVIFQSMINTTGNARKLPGRLVIPITGPVEAVYILHGCGYAKPLQAFANYSFHSKKGVVGQVPLVSVGRTPIDRSGAVPADRGANIQDWWSDYPHEDFPHARMVPLLEHDETNRVNRHVFLYTLEWINPSPKQLLTHMEIEVDPSVPTTLGLLAVTVVKPRAGA
jgi:DNA-binding LacI/PurR family transcriptional regulator